MGGLYRLAVCLAAGIIVLAGLRDACAGPFKVLVVMSYEEDYPWVVEIREGIMSVLADTSRLDYFYLNTKTHWDQGPQKARKAFERFNQLEPDGVIVADDDGQSMFVVPYLKDRVKTPVVFCGVNADPAGYGYPASNVTGVVEREPIKQSLLFLTQLVPSVASFGLIIKKSPTAQAVEKQLATEKELYPIPYMGVREAANLAQALQAANDMRNSCDAMLYITMEGLPDHQGKALSDKQILPQLDKVFGKPIITNALYRVKYGALCAVVKTGQEHGSLAAEMLLRAMQGTPVSQIPLTGNRYGRRIINVDKLVALGITPNPLLVRSATLVRAEK